MRGFKRGLAAALAVLALASVFFAIDTVKPAVTALVQGAERMRLQGLTTGCVGDRTLLSVFRRGCGVVSRWRTRQGQLGLVSEYFITNHKKIYLTVYHDRNNYKGFETSHRGTTLGAYYEAP